MVKPIPARILTHNITLKVCEGVDAYQAPLYRDVPVRKVCMQPNSRTVIGKENTEVTLTGVCFVDARNSAPAGLDVEGLKRESELNGHEMMLVFNGIPRRVALVQTCYDDTGAYHHSEIEVV